MYSRVKIIITITVTLFCLLGVPYLSSQFILSTMPGKYSLITAVLFGAVVIYIFDRLLVRLIRPQISVFPIDITSEEATPTNAYLQEQIDQLAFYDVLTGLPNRALLNIRLEHELSRARRERSIVAVMQLDIDRFKEINDSLCHNIGDKVLKTLAFRLTRCLRESDILARGSGDEFFIILPGINDPVEIEVTTRRILSTFSEPFMIDSNELHLTASAGISLYPADGVSIEILMKNVDLAMSRAKTQGGDAFQFFSAEIGAEISERRSIETHLRTAIDEGELRVFYQPQIDLFRRSIVGVEALVRWQHPEYGLIGPERFIHLAEQTGLIGQIDEWVLRTACAQIKSWLDAGFPSMHVSLNVSSHNFLQQEFLKRIVSVLSETGLSPDLLAMEISELTAMQNLEQTNEIMNSLNNLGVRISIDNFGTGYSSLFYLKRFPIHTIKIDSGFIQDILINSDSAIIVKAIIAMARSMKRKVVAVGVETGEQLDLLRSLHCDAVQGDIFGVPLAASEFQLLLEQQIWDNSLLSIH